MARAKSKKIKDWQRKTDYKLQIEQEVEARKYVFQYAFNDKIVSEVVCQNTPEDIRQHLQTIFSNQPLLLNAPLEERGLVLISQLNYSFYQNGFSNEAFVRCNENDS